MLRISNNASNRSAKSSEPGPCIMIHNIVSRSIVSPIYSPSPHTLLPGASFASRMWTAVTSLNDRSSPPSLSALLKLFDQDLCITDTVVEYALVSMADRYPDVYIMRGTAWRTGNGLHGRFVESLYKSSLPGSTFRADGTVEPSVVVVPLHLRHYVLAILIRGKADENMT